MSYSVGFTQNLVYLAQHLNGFVPTLMEDFSMLWSKEIYLGVWIWTSVYCRALASGHCFSPFIQENCLMLSWCTFPQSTAALTTHSCICLSVQTKAAGNLRLFTAIQHCVDDIRNWMTNETLLLNDNKTEFLMIGTKQQLAKVNIDHILIGDRHV